VNAQLTCWVSLSWGWLVTWRVGNHLCPSEWGWLWFVLCRFGGNPVCSAGGRAVLRVIEKEGIQQHAAQVGVVGTGIHAILGCHVDQSSR
jgi:hypothetical protein